MSTLPPSFAVALILALPIWITTDGIRPLVLTRQSDGTWIPTYRWSGLALRLFPAAFGVALCSVPGLLDLLLYDWMGYIPLAYVSTWAYGTMAGIVATALHALGLRSGLTTAVAGRLKAFLPGGPTPPTP